MVKRNYNELKKFYYSNNLHKDFYIMECDFYTECNLIEWNNKFKNNMLDIDLSSFNKFLNSNPKGVNKDVPKMISINYNNEIVFKYKFNKNYYKKMYRYYIRLLDCNDLVELYNVCIDIILLHPFNDNNKIFVQSIIFNFYKKDKNKRFLYAYLFPLLEKKVKVSVNSYLIFKIRKLFY